METLKAGPLLTDLYQLTMAHGYWKSGMEKAHACFHLFFRECPFGGGFAIFSGLQQVIEYIESFSYTEQDLSYLASLKDQNGSALFPAGFLQYLQQMELCLDIDAVAEGKPVFGNEPLIRVKGPLIHAQLVESALLSLINFPTLVATKAARICRAAGEDLVFEFGMRRAQGINGGVTASRAAYIGGCAGTSNLLAGKMFGIPVKGTHAHSWVQAFTSEQEAFEAYAETSPGNCIVLVDTYDTLKGVKKAVLLAKKLQDQGSKLIGIRLDSGDLAYLSIEARKILDENNLPDVQIIASNDLDEHVIADCKRQGAKVDVWGVGTQLATAFDEPALGGVYKLSAIERPGQGWENTIKLSEQLIKISTPGVLQVRRYFYNGEYRGDLIYDEREPLDDPAFLLDPLDCTRCKKIPGHWECQELLEPVFREGKKVVDLPELHEIRKLCRDEISKLHSGVQRFLNPHQYPVGITAKLYHEKISLIKKNRENS